MNFYDFKVKDRHADEVSMEEYKGKVVMVVNTATKCGLTPQYKELQALYEKYEDKGFVVLDFPCNQFAEQAPGTDEEISTFCSLTYGTKFPRFGKIDVNGDNASPLYKWLKEQIPTDISNAKSAVFEKMVSKYTKGNAPSDIKWNFGKFLINREGEVVSRYSPAIAPSKLEEDIKALL